MQESADCTGLSSHSSPPPWYFMLLTLSKCFWRSSVVQRGINMKMRLINKLSDGSLRCQELHRGFSPFLSAVCTGGAVVHTGALRRLSRALVIISSVAFLRLLYPSWVTEPFSPRIQPLPRNGKEIGTHHFNSWRIKGEWGALAEKGRTGTVWPSAPGSWGGGAGLAGHLNCAYLMLNLKCVWGCDWDLCPSQAMPPGTNTERLNIN